MILFFILFWTQLNISESDENYPRLSQCNKIPLIHAFAQPFYNLFLYTKYAKQELWHPPGCPPFLTHFAQCSSSIDDISIPSCVA